MYRVIFEDKWKKRDSIEELTKDDAMRRADALDHDKYKVISVEEIVS